MEQTNVSFKKKFSINLGRSLYNCEPRMTQEKFAELIGVEPRTVRFYLSGAKMPSIDKLPLMASILKVTVDSLVM